MYSNKYEFNARLSRKANSLKLAVSLKRTRLQIERVRILTQEICSVAGERLLTNRVDYLYCFSRKQVSKIPLVRVGAVKIKNERAQRRRALM